MIRHTTLAINCGQNQLFSMLSLYCSSPLYQCCVLAESQTHLKLHSCSNNDTGGKGEMILVVKMHFGQYIFATVVAIRGISVL